jgi:DNA polymerase-1
VPDSSGISLTFGAVERKRGHLVGLVRVHLGDALLYADTVRLDVAEDRRAFAEEVVMVADGATVSAAEIERALLTSLDDAVAHEQGRADEDAAPGGSGRGGSQADLLVEIGSAAELFHDPSGAPFARFGIGAHRETWSTKSSGFRRWLVRGFWERHQKAPNGEAISSARNVLEARAQFDGPTRPVYLRVAPDGLGGIVIDLGDPEWRVAHISPSGWRIVSDLSIPFRRSAGTLALPMPVGGGSLDTFRDFANVHDDDAWARIKGWLRGAARPTGPYWLLALYGEMGSAKTTIARLLASLIDPAMPALRSDPREVRDFVIAAQSRWVVAHDNVSHIQPWLSDAMCRTATGGGFATRELYSDADEVLFEATRPQLMTGITEYVTRGDLLDRAMQETLLAIPPHLRRRETELNTAFEAARPGLVGALFDDLAAGLQSAPSVKLPLLPRMADAAAWAVAVEAGRGEEPRFLDACWASIDSAHLQAIEASVIGPAIMKLLQDLSAFGEAWEGTAEDLLDKLADLAGSPANKAKFWPKSGRGLSGELQRLAPALRGIGVKLVTGRREPKTGRRLILLAVADDSLFGRSGDEKPGSPYEVAATSSHSSPGAFSDADQEGEGVTMTSSPIVTGAGHFVTHDGRVTNGVTQGDERGDGLTRKGDEGDDLAAHLSDDTNFCSPGAPIRVVETAAEASQVVVDLLVAPVLGLDTETTGLDPRSHRVRLVQVATAEGRVYVFDLFRLDAGLLAPLFDPTTGPVLVGHNLRFDLGFLAEAGLPLPNGPRLFDSMLGAHLLEDGADRFPAGHFTLAGVAERYLGVALDKSLQTSDWSGPLSDEQIAYAARDAAVLPRLHAVMAERLREHDLERVARLEMRALPALVWLERTGAPFDAEGWGVLAEQAARRQMELDHALTQASGTASDQTDLFGDTAGTVNWGSPEQVKRVLADRGHVVERVDEATLARLLDVEPLAQLLLDYREAAKRVGTYGLDFLKHVHPTTGRVHADWHQLGSRAGRMSCSKPNLQQIPRDRAYRACFRPAEGRAFVKADFSQIELRIAAEIANDERLLAAYAAGEDVHALTAAEVLGRRNGSVTKEDRQAAKALNFGLIYGAGGPTLCATAKTSYGVELSESDAMTFRRRFFDLYAGLKRWHCGQPGEDRPVDTRSLAGRRRLGVTRFTEKLNSPVQGTGADGLKAALALLWETRDRCPSAAPVLVVHDEIVLECDAADAEQAQAWLTDCMARGMQSFLTRVPVVVEATIERDWSGTPLDLDADQEVA